MIDEVGLWAIVNKCKHLKYKFAGVYSADTFPIILDRNTFVVVNSDNSNEDGTHWLLYCNREDEYCFGDPLGQSLHLYRKIFKRLNLANFKIKELVEHQLQKPTSNLCGLYCVYIAHYVFSAYYPSIPMIAEDELLRFAKHTF